MIAHESICSYGKSGSTPPLNLLPDKEKERSFFHALADSGNAPCTKLMPLMSNAVRFPNAPMLSGSTPLRLLMFN